MRKGVKVNRWTQKVLLYFLKSRFGSTFFKGGKGGEGGKKIIIKLI
jgi:hypothetical protein